MASENRSIDAELFIPMFLTDGIRKAVQVAESLEIDCSKVGERVDNLYQMLLYASCIVNATPSIYQRPLRRILPEISKNLSRALKFVRKCGKTGILHHFTIITASDFQEIYHLLDASLADLNWIITVFEYCSSDQDSIAVGLPPIAAKNPILSLVWSLISSTQMSSLRNRIEAAKELASLAFENDRNKRIIVEEGGISPLLKLLQEGPNFDAQTAAASVLCSLATDQDAVQKIVGEMGIPIIVQVLTNSVMRVQVHVANLISIMVESNSVAQEEFARENAIGLLVSLLSFGTFARKAKLTESTRSTNFRSLPTISEEFELNSSMQYCEKRKNENPDMKLKLRINCSKALWMLLRGSTSNSKRIIETKGPFFLAKHVEGKKGEFQLNCLMSVMEIAKAAEFDTDIQAALKSNSDAVKTVVDQLLKVLEEEYRSSFRIAAIKSIGSLALIFPEKETRVIDLLVEELDQDHPEIAIEAIIALGKFTSSENYLSAQHSKAIVRLNGVPPLMRLVKVNENSMLHGLILLCYLALHKECSGALEKAKVLSALEVATHSSVAKNPLLGKLIPKAIYHLKFYQAGIEPNMYRISSGKFEEKVGLKTYALLGCSSV
ncbi:Armadillo [Macleaya cordata]|uniref:Armadillo n=1 Tax=Macleaya cordata TaxID=56857 RepID=A0A200QWJ8_MACCD|nr:Armadillo [Macleaya cordata]